MLFWKGAVMANEDLDMYDFLVNDEDEAMLLLYVRAGEPKNPTINVDMDAKTAVLKRNDEDVLSLQGIPDNVIDSMQEADKLLVCELSREEDDKDSQIVFAYEADITD